MSYSDILPFNPEFGTVLGTGDMSHSVAGGQFIHNLHRKVSKDDLCYFALSFSLSVATLFSCVRVYIRPLDFGSTLVNVSLTGRKIPFGRAWHSEIQLMMT